MIDKNDLYFFNIEKLIEMRNEITEVIEDKRKMNRLEMEIEEMKSRIKELETYKSISIFKDLFVEK